MLSKHTKPDDFIFATLTGKQENPGNAQLIDPVANLDRLNRSLPDDYRNGSRAIVHLAGVGGFDDNATAPQLYQAGGFKLGYSDEAAVHPISYRGPKHLVKYTPPHGVDHATLVSATRISDQKTRLNLTAPGWTAREVIAFARITRPAARIRSTPCARCWTQPARPPNLR